MEADAAIAKAKAARRFRVYCPDELISRPRMKYLIPGVLPKATLIVAYGKSGAGKTFAIMDMCAAVATGSAWNGQPVAQGKVLYICAEGEDGFQNRMDALMQHRRLDAKTFGIHTITDAPDLFHLEDVRTLADPNSLWQLYGSTRARAML